MLRSRPRRVRFSESGLYVFESRHGPDFTMAMGTWDFDKLCLVRQGQGTLICAADDAGRRDAAIADGDLIYVPAGRAHRFVDDRDSPMTLVMVCFRTETLAALPALDAAMADFRAVFPALRGFPSARTHRRAQIMDSLRRMLFEQTTARTGSDAMNWGILMQIVVMLTRAANEVKARTALPKATDRFAQTLDFIDEHFTDPIQIKDLAAMAGLSYRRYTTLFKDAKGETVNAYLGRLRIAYAQKRLLETGNVLYAALEAGFGDLSHFYRAFKAATGTTPKRYMAANAATAPIHPV